MVGHTLADIRARLDELSVAVGPYRVVSSRTGDGPFPVTGRQFPDRERAAEAATVASAYRRALRRYDPHVAVHGLIVTETHLGAESSRECQPSLPEYCHRVAGALFETLADRHDPVERRVMNAYLEAAESTQDRERLCLEMLESTAAAVDANLAAEEQAAVLRGAATRLPSRRTDGRPVDTALGALRACDLLDAYTVEPTPDGDGRRAHRLAVEGYCPSLSDERWPVLPVVVELLRVTSVLPRVDSVTRDGDGWSCVVSLTGDRVPNALAVADVGT